MIFALDSIPAIFGLTKEPFLVFTADVFTLMGPRQPKLTEYSLPMVNLFVFVIILA